ncbi:MAG: hypothetical protein IT370_37650 [Deltaproteobacteria bacterium]|nr:hypothetical protein [Deltaproteobacteria bacterium]
MESVFDRASERRVYLRKCVADAEGVLAHKQTGEVAAQIRAWWDGSAPHRVGAVGHEPGFEHAVARLLAAGTPDRASSQGWAAQLLLCRVVSAAMANVGPTLQAVAGVVALAQAYDLFLSEFARAVAGDAKEEWAVALLGDTPALSCLLAEGRLSKAEAARAMSAVADWGRATEPGTLLLWDDRHSRLDLPRTLAARIWIAGELDGTRAVEYVVRLQSPGLVWAASRSLHRLCESEERLLEVLAQTSSDPLAGAWALRRLFEHASEKSWTLERLAEVEGEAELQDWQNQGMLALFERLHAALRRRPDAEVLLGSWLVFLGDMICIAPSSTVREWQPHVARVALESAMKVWGGVGGVQSSAVAGGGRRYGAAYARVLLASRRPSADALAEWRWWVSSGVGWDSEGDWVPIPFYDLLGELVRACPDPLSAWRESYTATEPQRRRAARCLSQVPDPAPCLVRIAFHAIDRSAGGAWPRDLWADAFAASWRHHLTRDSMREAQWSPGVLFAGYCDARGVDQNDCAQFLSQMDNDYEVQVCAAVNLFRNLPATIERDDWIRSAFQAAKLDLGLALARTADQWKRSANDLPLHLRYPPEDAMPSDQDPAGR